MLRLTLAALLLLAAGLLPSATASAQDQPDEPIIRAAIERALYMDTARNAPRLPRVSFDPISGDLTVVFGMRRPDSDDPKLILAGGLDDVRTILWAVYSSADSPSVRTTTVLGTYAVVGHYSRAREIPLVRAVMSVDHAAALDWPNLPATDLPRVSDVWWLEPELAASLPGQ